jgi:hypothetical protein
VAYFDHQPYPDSYQDVDVRPLYVVPLLDAFSLQLAFYYDF